MTEALIILALFGLVALAGTAHLISMRRIECQFGFPFQPNFPTNPDIGDTHAIVWRWDGEKWLIEDGERWLLEDGEQWLLDRKRRTFEVTHKGHRLQGWSARTAEAIRNDR